MLDSTFWLLGLGMVSPMALACFVENRSSGIWPDGKSRQARSAPCAPTGTGVHDTCNVRVLLIPREKMAG
jgi:hypothetical protein